MLARHVYRIRVEQRFREAVTAAYTTEYAECFDGVFARLHLVEHAADTLPRDRWVHKESLAFSRRATDATGGGAAGHLDDTAGGWIEQWQEGIIDALHAAHIHVQNIPNGTGRNAGVIHDTKKWRGASAEKGLDLCGGRAHTGVQARVHLKHHQPLLPAGLICAQLVDRKHTTGDTATRYDNERVVVIKEATVDDCEADASVRTGDEDTSDRHSCGRGIL
mmetsp:Transcript_34475/g.67815  ORF Transcript_34475/g.67815 Transcript_34475/m.67815 type:complete len:220 (+) Transcript_34475:395-1054(+)